MNYIGHFLIARSLNQAFAGHFLGDFVKGLPSLMTERYPAHWIEGIVIHRKVDSFVDCHPVSLQFYASCPSDIRRFAGIMLDLAWDHILAKQWNQSKIIQTSLITLPFSTFCDSIYNELAQNEMQFPETARLRSIAMRNGDWLGSYAQFSSLETICRNLSKRISRGFPLADGAACISERLEAIQQGLWTVLPELLKHVSEEN